MKINIVKLKTDEIEKIDSIEIGIKDYYEIPLEDNKYIEHKRKRNKRIYEKMGYKYDR